MVVVVSSFSNMHVLIFCEFGLKMPIHNPETEVWVFLFLTWPYKVGMCNVFECWNTLF